MNVANVLADAAASHSVQGGSVATFDGEGAIAHYFGVSNGLGRLVDDQTVFQAASLSKAVSSAVVVRAAAHGAIELDVDVREYVPESLTPRAHDGRPFKVTLRDVMSHRAGLTLQSLAGYSFGEKMPTLTEVFNGTPPSTNAPVRVVAIPGTVERYSSGSFAILQSAVAAATGQRFAEAADELILGPLKMMRSQFTDDPPGRLGTTAAGYCEDLTIAGGHRRFPIHASHGLWTTASDLLRFIVGISNNAAWEGPLLPDELWRQMLTPSGGSFGLGIRLRRLEGELVISHAGHSPGYLSYMIAVSGGGPALAITCNTSSAARFIEWTRGHIAHTMHARALAPVRSSSFMVCRDIFGSYRSRVHEVFVSPASNGLAFRFSEQEEPMTLVPLTTLVWIADGMNVEARFHIQGGTIELAIGNSNQWTTFERVGPSSPEPSEFEVMLLAAGTGLRYEPAVRKR